MAASELRAERWYQNSLMVTFAFRCNIACTFCMVEDILNVFEGTSLDGFKAHVERHGVPSGVERIIFSGGEVTLAKDLVAYAHYAKSLPGIRHVRLQTNATRLSDRRLLDALRDAGVDEMFVSLHAADAETYDEIAQRVGAFDQIIAGIRSIAGCGMVFDTNTAIVERNFRDLPSIVDLASSLGVRSMEFWNYWPRADEEGARAMSARVGDVQPHLIAALRSALERGIAPVVKWFPRCLLGDLAWAQDDSQPPALIDDEYWVRRPIYACLYEGVCSHAPDPCSGLGDSYVRRHGWEEGVLLPLRRKSDEAALAARGAVTRSLVQQAGQGSGVPSAPDDALVAFLRGVRLPLGVSLVNFTLRSAERSPHDGGLTLLFENDTFSARLRLYETNSTRRCFDRTSSLDVSYARVPNEHEEAVQALTRAAVEHLRAEDRGDLRLPR